MGDIANAIQQIGAADTARTPRPAFVPKPPQGKKPAVIGKGATPAKSGSGSGTLVETAFADRTYWATRSVPSSDGLFVMEVKPVKKLTLQGGDSIQFAEPPA